ncbi:hypothetical protein [Zavarzinella formosa]|uniref:hypothetical protein n=1 Tax=Zavarzinella formosa TaxID=360055 RepID=UPI0012F80C46|nr:hypothetical protein [Zavarzinella formosa]
MSRTPTTQDSQNAAAGKAISDRQNAEFEATRTLVESVLGYGWTPVGRHYLVSHDDEDIARKQGGAMKASAVVYTATKDGEKKHVVVIDEVAKECESYESGFGAMLTEPDPTRGFMHKGQSCRVHKFSLYWAGFEAGYVPRTAEQLAAARVSREERKVEVAAQDNPLFSEWVRAGEMMPVSKGRSPT